MDFKEYRSLFEDFFRTGDTREILVQYDIIRPFLKSVLTDCDIVPTDQQTGGSVHNFGQYSGSYFDRKKNRRYHTPDLTVAKRWHWDNLSFQVEMLAVVEIKSFCEKSSYVSPLKNEYGRVVTSDERYSAAIIRELRRHTSKNSCVILTDGIRWDFYHRRRRGEHSFKPAERVDLGIRRSSKNFMVGIEWFNDDEFEKLKNIIKQEVDRVEKIHSLT